MVKFQPSGKNGETVVTELEGALLTRRRLFPYFMLVALEAGGPLRAFLLLLLYPFVFLLELFGHGGAAVQTMIFISAAGLRLVDVAAVARATLPRFFLLDLSEKPYKAFRDQTGNKLVVTSMPRTMAEHFLKEYLGAEGVLGAELFVAGGRCTGLAAHDTNVILTTEETSSFSSKQLPKPLVFHDGRLVAPPTGMNSLMVLLWLPVSLTIATVRMLVGLLLPYKWQLAGCALFGLRLRVNFSPAAQNTAAGPTLYACNHKTLLDPVVAATALGRKLAAVTYSLSPISEMLSPITTVALTRDRRKDGETMKELLQQGDLVVCPEGTTCREPYLLRFSPLFADVAQEIVPVAVAAEGSMFYGSTVRGYKCLDSFFFLMNPTPEYRLKFLDRVAGGEGSGEKVAGRVQRAIAEALGYECTALTRRDKYRLIAGSDGRVEGRK